MLKERIMTAIVSLPLLFLGLTLAPKPLVLGFFLLCVLLSVYEAIHLLYPALVQRLCPEFANNSYKNSFLLVLINLLLASCIFLGLAHLDYDFNKTGILRTLLGLVPALGLFLCFLSTHNIDHFVAKALSSTFALAYGMLPWLAVWQLYLLGGHARYIILMLAIVMGNDSGAYFCGKKFGKRKLAPSISPNKTWEGALGGMLSSVFCAYMIDGVYGFSLGSYTFLGITAVTVGIFGIIGDLVESALKRFSKVKDSGNVFPGHGGFLDRCDAIILAAPVLCFLVENYNYFSNK